MLSRIFLPPRLRFVVGAAVTAVCLSLGGCAAMARFSDNNPDQSNSIADAIEGTGTATNAAVSLTPWGLFASPFILAATALGIRQFRRKGDSNTGNNQ